MIKSFNDIKNYSVGVIRGFNEHQLLLSLGLIDEKNLFLTVNLKQNTSKFLAGRVDLIVAYSIGGKFQKLHGLNEDDVIKVFDLHDSEPGYMAFNLDIDDKIISRLKKSYKTLKYKELLFEQKKRSLSSFSSK